MPPYAIAKPVIEAVTACLTPEARSEVDRRVELLCNERERVAVSLRDMAGVEEVYPSEANFLLVRVADSKRFADLAKQGGVLVRNFGGQVPNCLRVTIGNEIQNNQLIDSLKEL